MRINRGYSNAGKRHRSRRRRSGRGRGRSQENIWRLTPEGDWNMPAPLYARWAQTSMDRGGKQQMEGSEGPVPFRFVAKSMLSAGSTSSGYRMVPVGEEPQPSPFMQEHMGVALEACTNPAMSCSPVDVVSAVGPLQPPSQNRAEMHRAFRIKGLCSPPVTAFRKNGDLNAEFIKGYIQHLIDYGIPNAFVNGTTGEGNNLTLDERKQVAETWVTEGKGKLSSVIIQIGANNLRESQLLAKHAESIGADAIACVGTAYYKPETMDDYVTYMAEVSAAAPKMPFILYDIDFYTGITFDVSKFFTLAKERIPNLCGVKHTSPNFVSINNTAEDHPDIQVIMGSDEMLLQAMAVGVDTTICNSYMGNVLNRLVKAYNSGNIDAARKEQKCALEVGKIRRKYGMGVVGGTKAILSIMGMDVGQPRVPLSPISDGVKANIKKDLETIGFFDFIKKK